METTRVTELNGKRYTFFFMDEGDKALSLIYTPKDESKQIDGITIIKPHFNTPDHPVWYEIAVYDPQFDNMRLLGRIQVEKID